MRMYWLCLKFANSIKYEYAILVFTFLMIV